jgi:hypothetical protein
LVETYKANISLLFDPVFLYKSVEFNNTEDATLSPEITKRNIQLFIEPAVTYPYDVPIGTVDVIAGVLKTYSDQVKSTAAEMISDLVDMQLISLIQDWLANSWMY